MIFFLWGHLGGTPRMCAPPPPPRSYARSWPLLPPTSGAYVHNIMKKRKKETEQFAVALSRMQHFKTNYKNFRTHGLLAFLKNEI